MSMSTRQQIRTLVRQRRQSLSAYDQTTHSDSLVSQVNLLDELASVKKVALYLATDGELNTTPLIHALWQQDIETYLPIIHPFAKGHLLFLRYDEQTSLISNQYNIHEPVLDLRAISPVSQLDIIFTPMVAFDQHGQRLGMGGGYYDRTLAPWQHSDAGPIAIGLAHDCQQVDTLPSESWDIPLPTIVTPSKIWRWTPSTDLV
ncbi:5-formyltetrahydrofolate cyclo-ligase [Vibrio hangzhouensis]|nr:5-formyltetrahydrofolate cyclo-ligase [Vibrio hangzhouensis]MBY6196992.1 5-formyltetrahydrofolate cyclo-ligase [Vibrio hangzhouensis]